MTEPSQASSAGSPALMEDLPVELVTAIDDYAQRDASIQKRIETHPPQSILLREGEVNSSLFVVLDGQYALFKVRADGTDVQVSVHGAGDLLGVNSYATRKRSFCSARALTEMRCLRLDETFLLKLPERNPGIARLIDRLIAVNLASRYRKAVRLQLELAEANQELTETRNLLIHREKLATLGQLVAGLAHELNNPVAAMLRECDHLNTTLETLLPRVFENPEWHDFLEAGRKAGALAGSVDRKILDALEHRFSGLGRGVLRRIARLPEGLRERFLKSVHQGAALSGESSAMLDAFDVGLLLHALQISAQQVNHLVEGLKRYSRPANSNPEVVNLGESISNSLIILGNLTKSHSVELQIEENLFVNARAGDLGQIWTNLIKNACEAMRDSGVLRIEAFQQGDRHIVKIIDHGSGIPAALYEKVFEINFTTKTGAEHFGLGLGLSITKSLITSLKGELAIENTVGGGATFIVTIPAGAPLVGAQKR